MWRGLGWREQRRPPAATKHCVLGDLVTARASDWIQLVELPNNSVTWTTSDQARLTSGLKNYEERWVYDEEKECAGLDELNEMKISLEQLAKQKPVSFTSVMRTLDDGITLKEQERGQLAEEEGYSRAMKSPAALAMSDDDVRVMFATLIER
jgi:hypothetical protein